ELFPHSEVEHKIGVIISGKIIKEEEFVDTLKERLKEEDWEEKGIVQLYNF
ncbi:unnamed protein product, partial [marine sediment metagenome]